MAEVTTQMIKDLRERTQAGMSDCKKALLECDADMEKAVEYLRKKGIAQAAKKATRIASEGVIANYLHGTRIGVLVEVNCETDFVSRSPDFQQFGREVAWFLAVTLTAAAHRALVLRQQPPSQRLVIHLQLFLGQILSRQRRSKVRIALLIPGQDPRTQIRGLAAWARPTAQPVHQPGITFGPIPLPNAPGLAIRKPQHFCRLNQAQLFGFHTGHDANTSSFLLTHR